MTDQNPLGELLPCPFCGAPAVVVSGEHAFTDAKARCVSCSAEGALFDCDDGGADEWGRNRETAIAAWNARAHRPVEQEAVAWRWRINGLLSWNVSLTPNIRMEGAIVQPLFAASPPSRALSQDEREAWNVLAAPSGFSPLIDDHQPEGEANG